VEAASDLEEFRFTEFDQDEALECTITPGMPGFIFTRPDLNEFAEKTIRWPGHWQGSEVLKECSMIDSSHRNKRPENCTSRIPVGCT
jgi:lysine 6-dehydrogenase